MCLGSECAVSFPGLVSDSGHDGARLCPHWRNLPLLYGVSRLQKVCYIGFLVGSKERVTEWLFVGWIQGKFSIGKKREKLEKLLLLTS